MRQAARARGQAIKARASGKKAGWILDLEKSGNMNPFGESLQALKNSFQEGACLRRC